MPSRIKEKLGKEVALRKAAEERVGSKCSGGFGNLFLIGYGIGEREASSEDTISKLESIGY